MIQSVSSNSRWIQVSNGGASSLYVDNSRPMSGMVRWDSSNSTIQVFDGCNWLGFPNSHPAISLSMPAENVLIWAEKKMFEERALEDLIKKHPGLKELHDKFEMMKILCREENANQSV